MANSLLLRRTAIAGTLAVLGVVPAVRAELIYGITYTEGAPQTLVRFDSATPGTVTTIGLLGGMPADHFALAMDFRPATGQLYVGASGPSGTTSAAQAYTVDLATGAMTPVGSPFDPTVLGIGYPSFDFDPMRDELRVLATPTDGPTATNTRFHPVTNALVSEDADVAFFSGDRNAGLRPPVLIGAAYSNNFAGATTTTLYTYEMQSDDFATVGGVDGGPSPDGGQLFTVGDSGFGVPGTADAFGFDISGPSGVAYVSSFAVGLDGVHLFTVGLTGAMTDLGAVGTPAGTSLLDISVTVPEPASTGLLAAASLALLRIRSRR